MVARRQFLVWLAAFSAVPARAWAGDGDHDNDDDHDEREQQAIRRAVAAGEAAPLRDILDLVARDYPGEIVRVKAEIKAGVVTYKLRILGEDHGLTEVRVNAATREITTAERL